MRRRRGSVGGGSEIAVDYKCRGDEGQWEKSNIAVGCKCGEE